MPHFEVTSFLAAAIGLLGLISLCLLVFGRLGVGSIVAFLVAGIVIGQVRDIPAQTILAVHEFAEIGVVLMLFLIGLEIQLDQLRRLGRDVLAFGVPQIIFSALLIGLYVWWGFEVPNKHGRLRGGFRPFVGLRLAAPSRYIAAVGCPWVSESKRPKADISFLAGYLAVLKTFI